MTPSRRLASPLLAALLVAACAGGQASPVASAAPSLVAPSELASPTPDPVTPRPTAAPTPDGAQLPNTTSSAGRELEPGTYATPPWFLIPLSLELGDGWRAIRDDRARQVNLLRGENAVGHGTQWFGPYAIASKDVSAFVAELRATPLLTFADAVPVEIAGLPGEQIDAQAEPNPDEPGSDSQVAGTVDIPAMRLVHSPGIRTSPGTPNHLRLVSGSLLRRSATTRWFFTSRRHPTSSMPTSIPLSRASLAASSSIRVHRA